MITLVIKQTIRTGSFIAAFLLFTLSCQKEEFYAPKTDELTVYQAKAFVEMQQSVNFTLKSGNMQKQSIQIKADWEKAKCSSNDDVSVVETQIQALGRFGFATAESMNAWKETQNDAFIFSMSRLIVIRQKKTNETVSFIMSIAGDKQYLDSKNFNIWDNTYLKRDKTLSGYVLFHTLSGEFINGWIYCDGKITGTITQNTGLDLPVNLKLAQVVLYQWVEECTDYYTVGWVYGEIVSITYTGTSCTSRFVTVGGYDTGAFSGGGGYVPGGGTSGSGYINPVSNSIPIVNASDLARNPKADCIYQKLMQGGIMSSFIDRYFGITQANQSFLGELNVTWKLGKTTETLPIGVPRNGTYYSVEIRLNESILNSATNTRLALSMLHEALHAKLIAEFYDEVRTTNFRDLYAFYEGWGTFSADKNQETSMLEFYADDIAEALASFDQSQNIFHPLNMYIEAVKYHFANEILGINSYPSGYNAYIEILFNSPKICK